MGLFGLGPRTTHVRRDRLGGVQIAQSPYGKPVPIVYGTMRIPGSLIDYDLFEAIATKTKQRTGKSTIVTTDYTYRCYAMYALCEGEIVGLGVIWADKDRYDFTDSIFDSATGVLKLGALDQTVWASLTSLLPAKALNYSGTAFVAAYNIPLGGGGQLQNYSFEVQGLLPSGLTGAGSDAYPPEIIVDFLTNLRYGAGWDASLIADFGIGQDGLAASSYERYCQANGFFLSPALIEQRPAHEWLKEWLIATNSGALFSDGVLKVFPFGDQVVTGNSVTFTPYTTPVYALTADELLPMNAAGDLFDVIRRPQSDSFNIIPVEFQPRSTLVEAADYNASVVQDPEPVDTDKFGQRQGANLSLPCVTRLGHALLISRIAAQRSVYVRNQYRFRLPYRYVLLDPMDLVTLTDAKRGVTALVARLLTIDETEDGVLECTAEEWPFGVATGTAYTTEENDGVNPNTLVPGGATTAPQMFDIPLEVPADDEIDVGIVAAGGANWGGCEVWLSYDDVTYVKQGAITQKGVYGALTSALAAGSGFDVVNDADVDLAESEGALIEVSDTEAQQNANLSWLDYEFISFADATLLSPFNYTIARIQRGIFGTAGGLHAIGARFARMDEAMFRLRLPAGRLGDTIYVKLPSFNIYGTALQDLADVSPFTHVPSITYANPGEGPSLTVQVQNGVPSAGEATVTYDYDGLATVGIGGTTFASPPSSPWVVARPPYGNPADLYWITVVKNGQTITDTVSIDPAPFIEPSTPTILNIGVSGVFAPGDGGGECTVSWDVANMPGGVSYSVDVAVVSGDPISSGGNTVDPATSPQFVDGFAIGSNAIIDVTVTAYTIGPVTIATATVRLQVS